MTPLNEETHGFLQKNFLLARLWTIHGSMRSLIWELYLSALRRETQGFSPFQRREAWSEIDPWKVEAVWRILMWTKKTCGSKHPAKMFLLDQQRYTEEQSHTPLFTPFTGNGTYKSTKWNVLSRTWWSKMDGSWIESSTSCWCYLARILLVIPEEDASIK